MKVEELSALPAAVSWTDKPFTYYLHTIDRSQVKSLSGVCRYEMVNQKVLQFDCDLVDLLPYIARISTKNIQYELYCFLWLVSGAAWSTRLILLMCSGVVLHTQACYTRKILNRIVFVTRETIALCLAHSLWRFGRLTVIGGAFEGEVKLRYSGFLQTCMDITSIVQWDLLELWSHRKESTLCFQAGNQQLLIMFSSICCDGSEKTDLCIATINFIF